MGRAIILNGSPRKNGVDARIASMISERFSAAGHSAEIVSICDLRIGGCR